MARSFEKGFLQAIGFDDRDRHTDLHEAACLYLSQYEKAMKLWETVIVPSLNTEDKYEAEVVSSEVGKVLYQGSGYEFNRREQVVGVVDLLLEFDVRLTDRDDKKWKGRWGVIVEVKGYKTEASKIISQLSFYERFCPAGIKVAAVCFDMPKPAMASLKAHGILVVRLDPKTVMDYYNG